MVKEIQYTNIRRVLEDLTEHPMLADLTIEQVVRYTIRFIGKQGISKFYQDKQCNVIINEFRGILPCEAVIVKQVKDTRTGRCLRAMTDNFNSKGGEPAFKTSNRVLFTTFPKGLVEVAYKAIATDEDGFPLLIDNESYIDALEGYIKAERFRIKFDQGKISKQVLDQALQDYAAKALHVRGEFLIPSVSEMESITRAMTAMIPRMTEFDYGFKHLGDREYLRRH